MLLTQQQAQAACEVEAALLGLESGFATSKLVDPLLFMERIGDGSRAGMLAPRGLRNWASVCDRDVSSEELLGWLGFGARGATVAEAIQIADRLCSIRLGARQAFCKTLAVGGKFRELLNTIEVLYEEIGRILRTYDLVETDFECTLGQRAYLDVEESWWREFVTPSTIYPDLVH